MVTQIFEDLWSRIDSFRWDSEAAVGTSWQFLFAIHVIYGIGIISLQQWMLKPGRETPSWVKPFGFVHNLWMSFLSFVMLAGVLYGGFITSRFTSLHAYTCVRPPTEVSPGLLQFSMYVFYISKMFEFIDTILLILSKKKLIWLHKIHHLTTMSLVWHAMESNLSFEITAAGLNCFVHVIMYFYFAIPVRAIRSSITTTQITQFVFVLAASFYSLYYRILGKPCEGTLLAELHGVGMYGLYLAMFLNFFIRQYLQPKGDRKGGDKKNDSNPPPSQKNDESKTGTQDTSELSNDSSSLPKNPRNYEHDAGLTKRKNRGAEGDQDDHQTPEKKPLDGDDTRDDSDDTDDSGDDQGRPTPARKGKGPQKKRRSHRKGPCVGGELLFFPNELSEASALDALRILAKILLLFAAGVVCAAKLPEIIGSPLAIALIATAMSWVYVVGEDCQSNHFFNSKFVNQFVAFLTAIPIARPVTEKSDYMQNGRLWVRRMADRFFGLSSSHLVIYGCVAVFVPLMVMKLGWWSIFKYWLLPLAVMHFNLGSFSSSKGNRAPFEVLFPELKNFFFTAQSEEEKQLDLGKVPLYNLDRAVNYLSSNRLNTIGVNIVIKDSPVGVIETFWSFSYLPFLGREMLLWKKRDYFLHMCVGLGVIVMLSMSPWWGLPAIIAPISLVVIGKTMSHQVQNMRQLAVEKVYQTVGRLISESELRTNTDWIAIGKSVYNISLFADVRHPGGDVIRACGGTHATALFYSMHTKTFQKNLKVLDQEYCVGQLAEEPKDISFNYTSEFAKDLQTRVYTAMKNRNLYAPLPFWMRVAFLFLATLACEAHWATTGSLISMVLVGFLHCQLGLSVQHDASHGAMSHRAWVNKLFTYGADWVGNNKYLWFQQHIIGHHPHTNMDGVDPDSHSASPLLHFHIVPLKVRKFIHKFQWLYMFFVLAMYGPSVVYNFSQVLTLNHGDEVPVKHNQWLRQKIPKAVLWRLFYYARLIAVPYYLGVASLPVCMLGIPLVTGMCLTFVFVVSHNFEGSDRWPADRVAKGLKEKEKIDWYKMQCETSCSYGGFLSMLFTGGLNFQIEHHLFPRMSSWYYPEIAPIVQEVCKKHNVQYVYYPNLFENVLSCIRFMRLNGDNSQTEVRAPEPIRFDGGYVLDEEMEEEEEEEEEMDEVEEKIEGEKEEEKREVSMRGLGRRPGTKKGRKKVNKKVFKLPASAVFTEEELSRLKKKKVLPITINGHTYNIAKFLHKHPGGDIFLHFVGKDATDVFHAMHSEGASKMLNCLPKVNPSDVEASEGDGDEATKNLTPEQRSMIADFRELRKMLLEKGFFESSLWWYLYKMTSTVAIGVVGYALLYLLDSSSWMTTTLSGFLVGLMLQQLGWLTHEAVHHQIFKKRFLGNYVMGYPFGNFLQGFSVLWWKTRHNEHHACTNVLKHDPDIDTLPLLAWSPTDVENAVRYGTPAWVNVLGFQHLYGFPLLSHLHFIWQFQSVLFLGKLWQSHNDVYRKAWLPEVVSLVGHFMWRIPLTYALSASLPHFLLHWYISEIVGGLGIAAIVFCNHYPVEKLEEKKLDSWPEMQLEGTINMDPGVFNDWISGGLNYQIEHHLFPTLPRHNLFYAREHVMRFCEKHNLPYRSKCFTSAMFNILRFLKEMADTIPAVQKELKMK